MQATAASPARRDSLACMHACMRACTFICVCACGRVCPSLEQVLMDTDDLVAHPLLGPVAKGLLARFDASLNPNESVFPITRLPGAAAGHSAHFSLLLSACA